MDGVQIADLLLPGVGVRIDQLVLTDTDARVAVQSRAASEVCSVCGQRSSRVHCYYQRTLADRPVAGRRARVELRARRLVCGNKDCTRRTFTTLFTDVALFLGGRPSVRLFQQGLRRRSPARPRALRLGWLLGKAGSGRSVLSPGG
ncbi:transposase family protein [Streptomyces tsukubensis]|uniref:transposase family protein n=1 Tax=Streptomyces tsukubensis TaxID=83656 RepID=UPI00344FA2CE